MNYANRNETDEISELLGSIVAAARGAGAIMLGASHIGDAAASKEGHANFVTEYDGKVQDYLLGELRRILPGANFVGEEEGQEVFLPEYEKGYTFVVDPIDGTSNFMKGLRPSVTSIGLLKDGEPYLGVIYNPYTDQMFYAGKGCGAFENEKSIHTSTDPLAASLVSMGTAPYYEGLPEIAFELGIKYLHKCIDIRRSGSAAWDLVMVASGRCGLYFEPQIQLWDYAAGAAILLEAGGSFTDFEGKPVRFRGKSSVVAASRGVVKHAHEEGTAYLPVDF